MVATNYTTARQNLAKYCDEAVDSCEPVIITRKSDRNVVLISQEVYDNMLENLAIRANEEDYLRLLRSIRNLEKRKGVIVKSGEELEAMIDE